MDRQTQRNAAIASQAHDIAIETDKIAKLVVSDANAKEFIGKEEVKSRKVDFSSKNNKNIINVKENSNNKKTIKQEIKKEINNSEKDEWESF